jgi:hypothetical protein
MMRVSKFNWKNDTSLKVERKIDLEKIYKYYFLKEKDAITDSERNEIVHRQWNKDKKWFEWFVLSGAIMCSGDNKLRKLIDVNDIKDFNKFRSIFTEGERPDFVVNEDIGVEIKQLVLPENAILRKKAAGFLEIKEDECEPGLYLSAEELCIEEMLSKYVMKTMEKIDIWNKYNDKMKFNFLIIYFGETSIYVLNEQTKFKRMLENKLGDDLVTFGIEITNCYLIIQKL